MLAPNKQNLLILKIQKKLVGNGHKLLKEKRSGLILTFLKFAKRGRDLEREVSFNLQKILKTYAGGLTFISSQSLLNFLTPIPSLNLKVAKKRISGVYVDDLNLELKIPSRKNLKTFLNQTLRAFASFFPKLVSLSNLKINCQRVAREIEKTNRQIQNLENKIENIDNEIKFIETALNEKSNLEKATLIKIFK